jgi:apolipoprotein N-acyltransferase
MAFGRPELGHGEVLEHRDTRTRRWLRENRVRAALAIAIVEGILIAFDNIDWPVALVFAVAVLVLYFVAGRRLRSNTARQVAWIAAVSQALVALVPVLLILVGTLTLIVVAALAVIALILLFADRR